MSEPIFATLGCRLNAYETEAMKELSAAAGVENAVIVNTCAVTAEAVRKAKQEIRRLSREHPGATIIVTGCAAQTEPETFAAMPEVTQVIGNDIKLKGETWVEAVPHLSHAERQVFHPAPRQRREPTRREVRRMEVLQGRIDRTDAALEDAYGAEDEDKAEALHQRRDRRQLHRIDNRPHVDAFVQRIAQTQAIHPAFQLVVEALRHALLHQQAGACAADLALIEPDRIDQPFNRRVEIGVIKDDVGGFATQLLRQGFAGARRGLADGLANRGGAGEGHLVHAGMGDEGGTGFAVTRDDVQHTLGQASLTADFGEQEGGQGRVFGRLQHDGVTHCKCWRKLPNRH